MGLWLEGVLWLLGLYGLLVLLLAFGRWWRGRLRTRGPRPFISVLVLVRNREDMIEGLIREILRLGWWGTNRASFELVVVNDGSRDGTARILDRLARMYSVLKVIDKPPPGGGEGEEETRPGTSALERGLFLCRSRVVVFLDLTAEVEEEAVLPALRWLLAEGGRVTRSVAGQGITEIA